MQPGFHLVAVELVDDTLRALVEILPVVGRPPIAQVALAVELGTPVVKPVADFVADDGAHASVIHGVVGVGVIEGRLKNAGRENNFVERRTVIGVDSRRRHPPFGAVHWLADFRKVAILLKFLAAAHVAQIRAAINGQLRIIAPFIRVTDLHVERFQFRERLFFRLRAHPGKRGNVRAERGDEIVHHLFGAGFGLWRKIFLHVDFTKRLAKILVGGLGAALPAWLQFRRAGKLLAVKIKILLHKSFGKGRSGVVDHVPAQIDFPVGQRRGCKLVVQFLEEIRLADVDLANRRRADRLHVAFPGPVGRQFLEFRQRHFVVVLFRVAKFHARARSLCERSFKRHNRACFGSRLIRSVA